MIGSVKGIIPQANGSRIRPVLPVGCETSWRMACQRPLRRTTFRSCGTSSRPIMENQDLRNRLVEQYLPLVKYNGERIWARLARGRGARRPDLGRRVRPDGRHRRLRPVARREIRNLLRAAYSRRDARRAAHDGLGAASGALQGQQAERSDEDAGSQARPLAQRSRDVASTCRFRCKSSRK